MMDTNGSELIIPDITPNTKVQDISFDDISYVVAVYYATSVDSGISIKKLSSYFTSKDIRDEFNYAFLSHSQAFSNNIIEMEKQFNINGNKNYITLSNAFENTHTISNLTFMISINMRIEPDVVLYDIFKTGLSDELLGLDFDKQDKENLILGSLIRLYGEESLNKINPAEKV